MDSTRVISASFEQTRALGRILGKNAHPNDVIALIGPLGAGKTQFAKGIAQGLQVDDDRRVNSPTFIIVNEHQGRLRMYHVDVYRLSDEQQLGDLGFEEWAESGGVLVIEWADRLAALLPQDHLSVHIEPFRASRRRLTLNPHGPSSRALLEAFRSKTTVTHSEPTQANKDLYN